MADSLLSMKKGSLLLWNGLVWAASIFLNFSGLAQDTSPPAPPIVSLELVEGDAMETSPFQNAAFWAEFRVRRTGPVTNALVVYLNTQQGSARLGEDYWLDGVNNGSAVRIPAGTNSANVRLYPIDDDFYEGDEIAFFHLIAPPTGTPLADQYTIDLAHSSVEMVIHDNDPVATRLDITSPRNGQQFEPGDIIELRAQIIGPGSAESWSLKFFDGEQAIGVTQPDVPIWWADAWGGRHVISALATDAQGTVLTSTPPAAILVGPGATLPVVKIGATPWFTAEPCLTCAVAPSVLTIERTAPTNAALTVFLEIDGTATAGDDYEALPASVEIPAGQRSVQLTVRVRDDALAEGPEVVRVRVLRQPPPLQPPTYFLNVYAEEARVVIFDNEPEAPPARLDIIVPTNGSHLPFPSTIQLSALAVYTQNEVYGPVEFYAGDRLVARSPVNATTRPPIAGLPSVHTTYWTNPPVGQYVLTARTRLSLTQSITSPPVTITVDAPIFPVVRLETSPLENPQAPEFCPPNADCAYPSFVVHRSGSTDADLRVYLSYSGSATAGVDYPALPESVVIPAGREAVFLRLVPIDDALVEGPETVVATFTPVPFPGYIQDPNHASATMTILDNGRPLDAVVRIVATQVVAEEDSAPFDRVPLAGQFTISRTGPTNASLPVYVQYSGSATAGEDYAVLPGLVNIPVGATSTEIRVEAIPDQKPEGLETLVATISQCPPPGIDPPCYDFKIDPAHETATVFIRDDGLTQASLTITSPTNGANFNVGETILIQATAIDLDGYISQVEFQDDGQLIGISEIDFFRAPDPGTLIYHNFEWVGAPPGAHVLTAHAVSTLGIPVSSGPVAITVEPSTNPSLRVAITKPVVGAEFPPNTLIEIVAEASAQDGFVRKVEFFADGRKIGERGTEWIAPPPPPGPTQTFAPDPTQTFVFVWRYANPGAHRLTARATDDHGMVASSAPVEIRVTLPDLVPVVTVVARDAFAVEPGTNFVLNTATFRIRRYGPTNQDLTVNYSLHGTAENGVDYEMLPGLATIPAGRRSVPVTVRPLPDNLEEGSETLILRLEDAPADQPPRYRVGYPRHAVALISDGPWVYPATGAQCLPLQDGMRQVGFGVETGYNFRVEASGDLRNWETVCNTFVVDGAVHYVDDEALNFSHRFYRVTPEPVADPDE